MNKKIKKKKISLKNNSNCIKMCLIKLPFV